MKAVRRRRKKNSAVIRIVIVAVIAFGFFKFVQSQMQLKAKQDEINALAERIATETILNEDLQNKVDNFDDDNMDRHLREDGYVGPNDQVFQFAN